LKLAPGVGAGRLTAVYEPRCGRDLGTLIRRAGRRRLELAFVEQQPLGERRSCGERPRTRRITALDLSAHFAIAPLRDAPKALSREFTLALAPVEAGGIRVADGSSAAGGVTVRYRRACNEAPVGLVLGEGDEGATQVGVLVARYYNLPCSAPAAWAALTETGLTLPRRDAVTALAPVAAGAALRLHQPTRLSRDAGDLDVGFLADCGATYGVYAHDWRGALSVGVLSVRQPRGPGSRCKKAPGEVSLSQSFVASSVPAGELYPMRLWGLPAH
jgi:hypothetical protein